MHIMNVNIKNRLYSSTAELYQTIAYSIRKPKTLTKKSYFIISIDIDAGSESLGVINKGKNDANVNLLFSERTIGRIEQQAFPQFLDLFNEFEVPVTFAIRGQLTEVKTPLLDDLLSSSIKHDIGAHGYYHTQFKNLTAEQAENELTLISNGMKKLNIKPKSFVFPRNSVAHLDLLEKYGYKCFRGYGNYKKNLMSVETVGSLYNIHPSLFFDPNSNLFLVKKMFNISIKKQLPFHIWFHLWNFGNTPKMIKNNISKFFYPLLKYVKERENNGLVLSKDMFSVCKDLST